MGKIRNRKPIDMMGFEFQTWKVIAKSEKKGSGNNTYWLCECSVCGKQKELCGTEIRLNRTGCCKHNQKILEKTQYLSTEKSVSNKIKNEVGNRYGKLLVKDLAYTKNSHAYWLCDCDCGKTTIVRGSALRQGSTLSCGCLVSQKEEEIVKILDANDVKYLRQFTFSDLKDARLLRFDFAILNKDNNLLGLIEYQGSQHYEEHSSFGDHEKLLLHDKMKKQYCEDNQIPLLELNKENDLEKDFFKWYQNIYQSC